MRYTTPLSACALLMLSAIACSDDPKPTPSPVVDMSTTTDMPKDQGSQTDMKLEDQGDEEMSARDMARDLEEQDQGPDLSPATLKMTLHRDAGTITVEIEALNAAGQPASTDDISISADLGALEAATSTAPGKLSAKLTPPQDRDALSIHITASVAQLKVERDALIFKQIDARWDQPEAVPGLVNTRGWEDSAEISPDGQWLIVGTYSPVSLFECQLTGQSAEPPVPYGLPEAAACNAAVGPYGPPERPDMPGASRIMPGDIHHVCPSVGIDLPGDFILALPPVAAYGFKRQDDGSFAQPFVIAFKHDGCTVGPFGFTFPGDSFDAAKATMLFSFNDYRNDGPSGDTDNDLFVVEDVALGAPIQLGEYRFDGGVLSAVDFLPKRLQLSQDQHGEGNPFATPQHLFFDNEGAGDVDIYYTTVSNGALGEQLFPQRQRVGVSTDQGNEYQPFVYESKLYYARDFQQLRSAIWTDPSAVDETAFAQDQVELQAGLPTDQRQGAILSIGEPSLAKAPDGEVWLYFVYGVRERDGGVNQNIGRVRRKP